MSMKNPLTPAGIEPATYRFVAQHLNHCATAVPTTYMYKLIFSYLCLATRFIRLFKMGLNHTYVKQKKFQNLRAFSLIENFIYVRDTF